MRPAPVKLQRPYPPESLLEIETDEAFVPAPEVVSWFQESFIIDTAPLKNPDHENLIMASIGVLWTNVACKRQMLPVVGMMELCRPNPMLNDWGKAAYYEQLKGWFGVVPDFKMTLYAPYLATVDHFTFCAVVEHELYHARLKEITRKGKPIWGIHGHDVEEFVGVVRRYGTGAAAGKTMEFVEAANSKPLVGRAQVEGVCGTCLKLAA